MLSIGEAEEVEVVVATFAGTKCREGFLESEQSPR